MQQRLQARSEIFGIQTSYLEYYTTKFASSTLILISKLETETDLVIPVALYNILEKEAAEEEQKYS